MSDTTFPFGYGSTKLTWAQTERTTTVMGLQPEVVDRLYSLMHAAAAVGVPLGVGTGWRADQPDKPGFAANGNSNHQSFNPPKNAVAIDMVPSASWAWMEANAAKHGFRTFKYVNNEPWHIQPAEIPASRSYRLAPWNLNDFPCPIRRNAVVPPPPPVTQGIIHVTISADPIVLTPENAETTRGHADVRLFQRNMLGLYAESQHPDFNIGAVDSHYGPRCQQACKTFQAISGLVPDARMGANSWTKLMNP